MNTRLETIDRKILLLTSLTNMDCKGCHSLQHPPYAVCQQGISAVKKYLTDLKEDEESRVPAIPVYILGNTMSGKTSIIRSLQQGRRCLTYRDSASFLDETTRVFRFETLNLEHSTIKLIDHGGHQVYKIAYQLSLRDRCIPLIVVNLKEFEHWFQKRGPKEATRLTCFNWLSHFYLACPHLRSPILVLTHKDKLDLNKHEWCKKALEKNIELLRKELVNEESRYTNEVHNNLKDILHLSNEHQPVFDSDEVFEFGDDSNITSNIEELKKCIDRRCREFKVVLPQLWEQVGDFLETQKSKAYLSLSEIKAKYVDVEVILRYMHNAGRIFWFESVHELSDYIFHRIPAISEMISLFLHHCLEEQWQQRLDNFTFISHGDQVISKQEYNSLVQQFTENGVLEEALLVDLLDEGSEFTFDVALQLLQSFYLLHGPIIRESSKAYMIPYFASAFMDNSWETDGEIQLRLDILLYGLVLPKYAFQLMTVVALNFDFDPDDVPVVRKNGVTIHHSGCSTHLIHDYNNKKATLQVSTTLALLAQSWKRLLDLSIKISDLIFTTWKACRSEVLIYCAHCLYLRDPSPETAANPPWLRRIYQKDNTDSIQSWTDNGFKLVSCRRCATNNKVAKCTVPKPLKHPCEFARLLSYSYSKYKFNLLKFFINYSQLICVDTLV